MSDVLLSARGVRRSFGLTEALRGVDVDIRAGEILAIMGPSGSGKSTLLHVLAGVLAPDEGAVEYAGRRIDALNETDRARLRLTEFGFVFQFGQLLPDLSAADNVALPLLLAGGSRRDAARQARSWLERLGLADQAPKLPGELSGGQAQRVAVARALVTAPRVVFADEPTGSLDSLAAEKVMTTLTELARASGTTVVVVTHDARTASYADREIVVRDGRVSTVGVLA
ncbi:ABC transporter ATP-binding protein [Microbacterium sp. No. 7]|uniref:ABC transporter ATP-binding protein n=1 Tax=Microbacterium sp. No. 7 TaxID=1714373 RepID=UPI0006D09171|nr:ABC transporter ATP-binding protein [Microbacterium sp. No. 7]ALJ18483.1 ABC transporter ATP-binding protein [Microbacterium sp. No. 7]